jgi:hypothetical protein
VAASSDIRAGRAFVEIYLNKSALTKGLKTVAGEFKAFGDGAAAIGKRLMAMGTAVAAPMLLAAKSWAESGAELARMSQRTGLAVEQLSALKFAAESSGVEIETLESGVKKMQKSIYASASGKGEGPNFLRGLAGMDAEKQLEAIADKMATISNPTERAAVAMQIFGKGGTAMLPMLEKGAAGLRAYRKEAESMGLIRSKGDAQAALQLDIAWRHLTGSVTALKNAIGGAIGPLVTGFLRGMTKNILAARDWIKAHQPLAQMIFKIGVTAIAAGAGVYALGKAASLIGGIFSAGAKIVGIFGHVTSLLLLPVKMVSGLIGSVLSGALSIVKGAFSMVGSVISGAFAAGLWALKTTLGAVTVAWNLFTGALNIGISVITGVASAISSFIAMGPLGLLLLIPAALGLVAAFSAVKPAIAGAASGLADFGAKAGGAVQGVAVSTGNMLLDTGSKIRAAVPGWANSIRSFATDVGAVVGKVFVQLRTDAVAGFNHLVTDIGGSWDTLQTLLSTGNFSEAWTLGLAIMKLEWVRFSNYLSEQWEKLTPTINVAVDKTANLIGDTLTNLKISWGDVWDLLQAGLKTFLTALDAAFDTIKTYIAGIQGFLGKDPVQAAAKAKELRTRAAELKAGGSMTLAEGWKNLQKPEYIADLEKKAREQEEIAQQNKWMTGSGPGMASMVSGPRTEEQKAAEDKADIEKGEKHKAAAKGLLRVHEKGWGESEADRMARAKEQADAEKDLAEKKAHAGKVVVAAKTKQKFDQDKLAAGAGAPGGPLDKSMMGGASTKVAFGSVAASGLGGAGGIGKLHDMTKHYLDLVAHHQESLLIESRRLRLEAAQ